MGNRSSETGKQTGRIEKRTNPEISLQSIKCFKCSKLGHVAKDCPEERQNQQARRITLSEGNSELQDPWLLMLSAGTRQQHQQVAVSSGLCTVTMTSNKSLNIRGPTYKAGVIVEGVKVRALLDHGAQVSLVHKELLPKIKERNGWTLEECHDRNCQVGRTANWSRWI